MVITPPLISEYFKPHDYIKKAIDEMKDYCLPYGQMKIATPETGAIIALLLYFISHEPTIGRTKLECYTILLNRIVKTETGKKLFIGKLNKRGRISCFKKIPDYMLKRGLVSRIGRYRFRILSEAEIIVSRLSGILDSLLPFMDKILRDYSDMPAGELLKKVTQLSVVVREGIEYVTLSKASEELGLSFMLLVLLCRKGKIEGAIRENRGLWLIPRSSLKTIRPKVIM